MLKDHYVVLGIQSDASADQIKEAYRRRALEVHPDVSGTDSQAFLAVQEAYSTLSDPARRSEYDLQVSGRRLRSSAGSERGEPLRSRESPEPIRPRRPGMDLGDVSLFDDFWTYSPSLDDTFERLWSNFCGEERPKGESIRSLTVDIPISAEQAYYGGTVHLEAPALVECPLCGGSGAVDFFECWRCAGQGRLVSHCTVAVSFPAGLTSDYIARIPLDQFGIRNFYLTVRFRVSEVMV